MCYVIGRNEPGFLPDSTDVVCGTFSEAVETLITEIEYWARDTDDNTFHDMAFLVSDYTAADITCEKRAAELVRTIREHDYTHAPIDVTLEDNENRPNVFFIHASSEHDGEVCETPYMAL